MRDDLAFVQAGDPESPAVLFLHGWPTSAHLWREMVPLVSPWMRAIAPDLPDPGDLEGSTASVRSLLRELGIGRFAAVGHAEGGAIAQLLAVDGGVQTLVLIDSVALDARPGAEGGPEQTLRANVRTPERLTDEVLGGYLRNAPRAERIVTGSPPDAASLARLEIPTLVLWGEEDELLPVELAERLGDALPRAAVALLPGCGHFLLDDASETVVPLVFQYLRSQYLGTPHSHEGAPLTVQIGPRPPEDGRW
jgi:pimeloyl-ACP methyl ester carboxylesterase